MEFEFADRQLLRLYSTGRTRKLRVSPQLARKFVERVNRLADAVDIYDLRDRPSMRLEKLEGSPSRFSIRVDRQWRLVFDVEFNDGAKTTGKAIVRALSEHDE